MKFASFEIELSRCSKLLLFAGATTLLSACGGGSESISQTSTGSQTMAPLTSGTTTLQLDMVMLPDSVAEQLAQPSFHMAPVQLSEPDDVDTYDDNAASARHPHHRQFVPAELGGLSTRRLTFQEIEDVHQAHGQRPQRQGLRNPAADVSATPMAAGSAVSTYTPAQIRAAYGLPALPLPGAQLTSTQAAQLGAGQTIYIVAAMNNPNAVAELAAFNQKFGLPTCVTKTMAASASLPLAVAPAGGCEFSVVYSTASGRMTSAVPAYDSGWASEIALDVQWAHATAPLARIILIEAPDATLNSLLGAVKLANSMGPGSVSMSFGAAEGNWTASVDSAFASPGMTYLAATGDSGAGVQWPSVSANVVAVGGTTLTYSGVGPRTETAWSRTGGGASQYAPTPSYQTSAVPDMGTVAHRTVADVSFNADPASGQYIAVMPQGSSSVRWASVGGTSLSTPQWAGIIAVANALRGAVAKPALGAPHSALYGQIATVPGLYASAFADIVKGTYGLCTMCSSRVGYDPLTGLGTPNVTNLLGILSGATVAPPVQPSPVVTSASIAGKVGTALSFKVSATAPNPLTFSMSNSPAGLTLSNTGTLTWPAPIAGIYQVTITAQDAKTGLSGQGVITISISSAGPVITAAAMKGIARQPLTGTINVSDPGVASVSVSISGAPLGTTFSVAGTTITARWSNPVLGSYSMKVSVVDSVGGSAQATIPITITAN